MVEWFIESVCLVPRLRPLQDNVFILTDPNGYQDLVSWASASGFPLANILNNGAKGGPDLSSELAYALGAVPDLADCSFLAIASLDTLLQPGFNLQRLIEHTVIRSKDTVVFFRPPPGEDLARSGQALLSLEDEALGAANPRVLEVMPPGSGCGYSDGVRTLALAPFLLVKQSSLGVLTAAPFSSSSSPSAQNQFSAAVACLLSAGKPVYALEEDLCLDVSSPSGLALADACVSRILVSRPAIPTPAAVADGSPEGIATALWEVTQTARAQGLLPRGDPGMEALVATSSDTKKAYLAYLASPGSPGTVCPAGGIAQGGASKSVPTRFADVSTRRHAPRRQNPCYQTTNNDYGRKKPSQMEMPDVYAASSQKFSTSFVAGPGARVSTLVTSVRRSKVHNLLDDL